MRSKNVRDEKKNQQNKQILFLPCVLCEKRRHARGTGEEVEAVRREDRRVDFFAVLVVMVMVVMVMVVVVLVVLVVVVVVLVVFGAVSGSSSGGDCRCCCCCRGHCCYCRNRPRCRRRRRRNSRTSNRSTSSSPSRNSLPRPPCSLSSSLSPRRRRARPPPKVGLHPQRVRRDDGEGLKGGQRQGDPRPPSPWEGREGEEEGGPARRRRRSKRRRRRNPSIIINTILVLVTIFVIVKSRALSLRVQDPPHRRRRRRDRPVVELPRPELLGLSVDGVVRGRERRDAAQRRAVQASLARARAADVSEGEEGVGDARDEVGGSVGSRVVAEAPSLFLLFQCWWWWWWLVG